MMKIKLAGFNVDLESLKTIENISEDIKSSLMDHNNNLDTDKDSKDDKINYVINSLDQQLKIINSLTPEVISASYARISRDPKSIPELRKNAQKDIEKCRKTNSNIIFKMGHKSIAEHAVFNFDIMGVSRGLVEKIEQMRLTSYMEESQRYIDLNNYFDFVIPSELNTDNKLRETFIEQCDNNFKFYKIHKPFLIDWMKNNISDDFFKKANISNKERKDETIFKLALEDSRYALPLATTTQLGMTINARNLETLITRMNSSKSSEEREFGKAIYDLVDGIAPSVIKYTEPTDYFSKTRDELKNYITEFISNLHPSKIQPLDDIKSSSKKINYFNNISKDKAIISGLIFSNSNLTYDQANYVFDIMNVSEKKEINRLAHKYQELHDVSLREFELREPFELVISASNFAQLKRHRMNTLIPQDYDIDAGYTTPESLKYTNEKSFSGLIERTNYLYNVLKTNPITKPIANYILTNAHNRRVLFDANNRQLKAIANERLNVYAQWDIRNTIEQVIKIAKEESPLTMEFAPGKHEYYDLKEKIYGNSQ